MVIMRWLNDKIDPMIPFSDKFYASTGLLFLAMLILVPFFGVADSCPAKDLIVNGGFEAWQTDRPDHWTITPSGRVKQANAGYRGTSACELLLDGKENVTLEQEIHSDILSPSTELILLCAVKSTTQGGTTLSATFPEHQELPAISAKSESNPGWQMIRLPITIPASILSGKIVVRITARHPKDSPLLVDAVSLAPLLPWRSSLYPESWKPAIPGEAGDVLHDFSYAGYRNGQEPPSFSPELHHLDVVRYFGADPNGVMDSTPAIQEAIDTAAELKGGKVFLPEGTYRCEGPLCIQTSHILLSGDGPEKTRLMFTGRDADLVAGGTMQQILFEGEEWPSTKLPLTEDVPAFSTTVFVDAPSTLKPGDDIVIGWYITEGFVREHEMVGVWQAFNDQWQPFFQRTVVSVKGTGPLGQITLDVPLRYPVKVRDGASLILIPHYLEGCGLQDLSISDAHPEGKKWSDVRFSIAGMYRAKDGWIRNVTSFASGADGDYHLQNNGFRIENCKRITLDRCSLANPQNRGPVGGGYLFELAASSEILLKDCNGVNGRHNFIQNWGFGTSGCVFLRCYSSGSRTFPDQKSDPNHKGWTACSEFHHSLAMACLVDLCVLDDGWLAGNRGGWSKGAGHTSTGCVFWNCSGKGTLSSWQYGSGYVVGSRDLTIISTISEKVANNLNVGTAPEDIVQGEELGGLLQPASLYEDQLARRIKNSER